LAQLYQPTAEVELVGPLWSGDVWEPIRNGTIPCRTFRVSDEAQFYTQALHLARARRYDVVHLSKPRAPNLIFGMLYQRLWGSRVLIDVDDEELAFVDAREPLSLSEFLARHGGLPIDQALHGTDWTRLAVGMVSAFDGITTANNALQSRYGGTVIPHARDEGLFKRTPGLQRSARSKFGIPENVKVVLFVGTPRQHKGVLEVAQAVAKLGRKDIVFVIVGEFPDKALQAELRALPGNPCIFLGNQPFVNLHEVTSIGDLCVLYRSGRKDISDLQTPAKLTDALAMGVPVLATATPALEDIVEYGAIMPIEHERLGVQIEEVLENNALRKRLQEAGRRYFEAELSLKVNRARLKKIIDEFSGEASQQASSQSSLRHLLDLVYPEVLKLISKERFEQQQNVAYAIDQPTQERFLSKGNAGLQEGRYGDALRSYLGALQSTPEMAGIVLGNINLIRRRRRIAQMMKRENGQILLCSTKAAISGAQLLALKDQSGIQNVVVKVLRCVQAEQNEGMRLAPQECEQIELQMPEEQPPVMKMLPFALANPADIFHVFEANTQSILLAWVYLLLWQSDVRINLPSRLRKPSSQAVGFFEYLREYAGAPIRALLASSIAESSLKWLQDCYVQQDTNRAHVPQDLSVEWVGGLQQLRDSMLAGNDETFVTALFEMALGRIPRSHEKRHYTDLLKTGRVDRDRVTTIVCTGMEAENRSANHVARVDEPLPVPDDAPGATQALQDYLYNEFGLPKRTLLVAGMRHFRLPMNPSADRNAFADEDMQRLAQTVVECAASVPVTDAPLVSIIIPAYNQLRFTLACVYSILAGHTRCSFEIIIADDCSTDQTAEIFSVGIPNVRHVRPPANLGFLRNCNYAARQARGQYVVLLNNDTYILPGWLDHLIDPLDADQGIGVVGSKLVFADGRLQEAGGLVFADGSGWNYGRFDDPRKPDYCYLRDSDYVSGAVIAIRTAFWRELGGFDECYEMAYYEDTDLAFRVRAAGKRVVVQPLSQLIHFEGISSGTDISKGVKRYQVVNGETFFKRWAITLQTHGTADPENLPIHRNSRGTILVVDSRTPMPDRDSGSMDTYQYLRILKSFGYHVIFVPQNLVTVEKYSAMLQTIGVQVLYAPYWMSMQQVLENFGARLKYVLLYRAPVAEELLPLVRKHAPQAKVIFDTVDLHYLRMEREAELEGSELKRDAAVQMREMELGLIRNVDATIVLSRYEMEILTTLVPGAALFEIPIVREVPVINSVPFQERHDIVFVGGFEHPPNVDAVRWFIGEVLPLLQRAGFPGKLIVVGSAMPGHVRELARNGVEMRGYVEDLDALFSEVRLSVAPLRYGAGLKGKVISSLSLGVPVVATGAAVEGGGFTDGENVTVANTADEMAAAISHLYHDEVEGQKIAAAGRQMFVDRFSVAAVSGQIEKLLTTIST
jgi:glycosyltransferase involved in cell wall biosynthesis